MHLSRQVTRYSCNQAFRAPRMKLAPNSKGGKTVKKHNGYPETSCLFLLPLQQNSTGLHQLPLQKNKDQTPICSSICTWVCRVPQYLEVNWSEMCREHSLSKPGGSQLIPFLIHCFLKNTLHTTLSFSPSQRCPLGQKRHFVSTFLLKNCHAVSAIYNKCLCVCLPMNSAFFRRHSQQYQPRIWPEILN